jgi:hypothetical protein
MSAFRSRRSGEWSLGEVALLPGVPLLEHVNWLVAEQGEGPLSQADDPLPDKPPQTQPAGRFGSLARRAFRASLAAPGT